MKATRFWCVSLLRPPVNMHFLFEELYTLSGSTISEVLYISCADYRS